MAEALIHFYVVAFPELHGAETAVAQLKSKRKLTGVKAALILQKDHSGRLNTQDIVLVKHGSIYKTSNGKIQRHACRRNYLAETLERI